MANATRKGKDASEWNEALQKTKKSTDGYSDSNVNHPAHYNKGSVECIYAIESALGDKFSGFLAGNVIKYIYRYDAKNGIEDVKKAIWYAERLLDVLEAEKLIKG